MNVMNGTVLILFVFVNLASSGVLSPEPHDDCKDISPEVYCASNIQTLRCNKVEFCKTYLQKSYCERGPEAYCKTVGRALTCGKEAYCLTWPNNDSVTAVKMTPPPSAIDMVGKAISDWLERSPFHG